METVANIESGLGQFCGTEAYHRLTILPNLVATDGVAWLCKNAECFWLMDAIASYQGKCMKDPMLQDMQFWTLTQNTEDNTAVLICERDTGDVAIKQELEYSSFPLPEIKIWVEKGWAGREVMVAMLPSER